MNHIARAFVLAELLGIALATSALADPPAGGAAPQAAESKNDAAPNAPSPQPALPAATASPEELVAFAKVLEQTYAQTKPPESVRMLIAIARGSQMAPGEGWFGPAQSRYDWQWLVKLHGVPPTESIAAAKFRGTAAHFDRLDRNKDGQVAADDFDWSDNSPFVRQSMLVSRLFRRLDAERDGRLTREELVKFFEKVSQGKDALRLEDFQNALIGGPAGFAPGDAPSPEVLLRGLFRGEIGSLNEGPGVDEPAPDFRLSAHDGSRTIRLSEQWGAKPVVLVFGNFTCGPFRSLYPQVDEICQRYRDEANFLAVYVREAHPTDGWHMESNASAGVKVAQPQSFDQRVGVAQQCQAMLKYSMPLLVDEMHDPVGNSYSGMPARLYVIDAEGRVVYKSGRGPFGFKSGEMEQALLMTLLDRHTKAAAGTAGSAK